MVRVDRDVGIGPERLEAGTQLERVPRRLRERVRPRLAGCLNPAGRQRPPPGVPATSESSRRIPPCGRRRPPRGSSTRTFPRSVATPTACGESGHPTAIASLPSSMKQGDQRDQEIERKSVVRRPVTSKIVIFVHDQSNDGPGREAFINPRVTSDDAHQARSGFQPLEKRTNII